MTGVGPPNSMKNNEWWKLSDEGKWMWKIEWEVMSDELWVMSDEWRKLSDQILLAKQALIFDGWLISSPIGIHELPKAGIAMGLGLTYSSRAHKDI